MHDVNSRGSHLAREDLCQRTLTELAYREVEMSLPANHRRRGPDQGNRSFARLLHQPRRAASDQEGAEAVVPPGRFECRDLDVDGATGTEFLKGVDHQVRNSQFIRDRPEQPVDGSLIRRVAGMSGCCTPSFRRSFATRSIRVMSLDASSLRPAEALRWLESDVPERTCFSCLVGTGAVAVADGPVLAAQDQSEVNPAFQKRWRRGPGRISRERLLNRVLESMGLATARYCRPV